MTLIVCALHLLAAEYIPAQRSKGDILRFRRTNSRRKKPGDPEAHELIGLAQDIDKKGSFEQEQNANSQSSAQVIMKQSMVFHWHNLSYDIKSGSNGTKRILHNIDGWVKPGTLTALMVSKATRLWRQLIDFVIGGYWRRQDNTS